MGIEELIADAKNTVIEERMVQATEARLAEAERQFEEKARSRSVDEAFLSRAYSL